MKFLIHIGHPAHVHLFRNLIKELRLKNFSVVITVIQKDINLELLKSYNFKYLLVGKHQNNIIRKFSNLFKVSREIYKIALKEKPDVLIGMASSPISYVSRILGSKSVILDDTENAHLEILLYRFFANTILTPYCFKKNLGKTQIRYSGYHELSYLSPKNFKPNPKILEILGLKKSEKYVIIRFVSWNAVHDKGNGIKLRNKIKAVKEFSKYAKVFISSEKPLPKSLEKYRIKIQPEKMHDALYFSSLCYGESATMASESACLGTPSIYLDRDGRGYTDEQEQKYGLVFNFKGSNNDQLESIKKGLEILNETDSDLWLKKKNKLLKSNISVTPFLLWFLTNYPDSLEVLESNKIYEDKFRHN